MSRRERMNDKKTSDGKCNRRSYGSWTLMPFSSDVILYYFFFFCHTSSMIFMLLRWYEFLFFFFGRKCAISNWYDFFMLNPFLQWFIFFFVLSKIFYLFLSYLSIRIFYPIKCLHNFFCCYMTCSVSRPITDWFDCWM